MIQHAKNRIDDTGYLDQHHHTLYERTAHQKVVGFKLDDQGAVSSKEGPLLD